jgi:hypothetical protein
MADTKISALTDGNPAQSGDEIPIARSGANYKITAGSIASLGGDVDGPASATDNQIALFDSTTGKLIKAATTTGLLKASSGVIAAATSGTDYAPATTGTNAQLLANNGSGGFSNVTVGSGLTLSAGTLTAGLVWQSVQTTGFTAVAGRAYPCNTTSAAFTVTLPSSPSAGDQITLTDYAGTFATNNLTINPNGGKIRGSTDNAVISTSNNSVQLVYVDSTRGWIIYAAVSSTPLAPPPSSVDYLIVAGGGGGAGYRGGGGGAGGYRTGTSLSVTSGTTYTITVGGAGAGGIDVANGSTGGNSYISGSGITANPAAPGNPYANAITSFGGGGGGQPGLSGGSGGGSRVPNPGPGPGGAGNTPSTSPSQGNNGGTAVSFSGKYGASGGGGAGAVGADGSSSSGGNGGAGQTGPSFASSYGVSGVFAGGGAGGAIFSAPSSTGGTGGGGNSPTNSNGQNGTTNTGGGGGGANSLDDATRYNGGNGGSGIVIIAYPSNFAAAVTTTGSPTVTVSGGNRIYAFTGNGTIVW